jgi:hypothetical protein
LRFHQFTISGLKHKQHPKAIAHSTHMISPLPNRHKLAQIFDFLIVLNQAE